MNNIIKYQLPERMSSTGVAYDWLFSFVFWASMILFVFVIAIMIYFVVRYHRSRHPESAQTHDHTKLELFWTFSPLIILVLLFHWGFEGYIKGSIAPDDAIEIRVRGKQWLWEFEYPNGYREIGTLKVPVETPIKLIMSSEDVLHSFFVPEFRWKKDVVPGSYESMWFRANKTGTVQVYCAEYCGTSHSAMLAKVEILSAASYEKFLKEGSGPPPGVAPAEWGKLLYTKNACNTCHSLDGSNLVGPTWKGLFGKQELLEGGGSTTVDENYIRESILKPNAKVTKNYKPVMPVFAMQDQQIDALIAFIKTLK